MAPPKHPADTLPQHGTPAKKPKMLFMLLPYNHAPY